MLQEGGWRKKRRGYQGLKHFWEGGSLQDLDIGKGSQEEDATTCLGGGVDHSQHPHRMPLEPSLIPNPAAWDTDPIVNQ